MLVASLDTSTLTLSCALCELSRGEVKLVAERTEHAVAKPRPQGPTGGHGGRLPGALVDLLVATGLKLPDLEGYAIGLGPGSFTGLRIGLATWKGLAYGNQRPIAGASSLAAMASAAAAWAEEGTTLVPLLDAKKGELYAGFYRVAGGAIELAAPEAALAPSALATRLSELAAAGARPVALGAGLEAYPDALSGAPGLGGAGYPPAASDRARADGSRTPSAIEVARLASPSLEGAGYDAARLFSLEPHYVRPSEAELKFPNGLFPLPAGKNGAR
jgi:tRNA threonylcarbamoyladenosine biosynthesis protein TsaB